MALTTQAITIAGTNQIDVFGGIFFHEQLAREHLNRLLSVASPVTVAQQLRVLPLVRDGCVIGWIITPAMECKW